jgi:hypothetical protein
MFFIDRQGKLFNGFRLGKEKNAGLLRFSSISGGAQGAGKRPN